MSALYFPLPKCGLSQRMRPIFDRIVPGFPSLKTGEGCTYLLKTEGPRCGGPQKIIHRCEADSLQGRNPHYVVEVFVKFVELADPLFDK